MTTETLTSPSRARRLHYAWVVLATTTLVLLASGGVRAAIGVFVKPLEAEFGWSRTALSFAVAVSIALYGLTGPSSAGWPTAGAPAGCSPAAWPWWGSAPWRAPA